LAEDSDLEKTESASPRRLEKAREEGDVPRSRELATFAVLAAAALGLWTSGEAIVNQLKHLLRQSLSFQRDQILDPVRFGVDTAQRLFDLLLAFLPLSGLLMLAAVASPLLIGGWLFHAGSFAPDFGRLSPMRGLGNMLSLRSLSELLKAVAKTLLVGLCAWFLIQLEIDSVLGLASEAPPTAASHLAHLLLLGFAVLVAALTLIALFDAPYQVWSYGRKLMMTRQELRDEAKEAEGSPELPHREAETAKAHRG